ncbi:MAG: tRNA pseudouridine(38-40) synthase TruA [Actinobacteria bacterium]|nr:MAG: tRNA pseudouridine(38-40) synthase TruA [Actinomycetota bacterium]
MRNIRLILEYNGERYAGFQRQPDRPTIQSELEKALSTLLGEKIEIVAAGRTDAGVHAWGQVVNFKTNSDIICFKIRWSTNGMLPDDIVATSCEEVSLDFDARRDAKRRVYKYFILNRLYPSAFFSHFTYFLARKLNLTAMRQAASYLIGEHDFSSFCTTDAAGGNVRKIERVDILREDDLVKELVSIHVEGQAFLHNMVRIVAGTLIEVGLGNMPPERVAEILESRDRTKAGPTAPARGLVLVEVEY